MKDRVEAILSRLQEVETALADSQAYLDQKKYRELSQQHAYLSELKEMYEGWMDTLGALEANHLLLRDEKDPEWTALIKEEERGLEKKRDALYAKIETLLIPPDPDDDADVILEIRAGTGGDEAAIFVGDCARMYRLYAVAMGWKFEVLSLSPSEAGGYKECIFSISGKKVYRHLQYEAGTHRVQRVPVTETQGRVHTSAITVAVLMEPGEEEKVEIDERDLKIDTYRSSGAGGQHVNTTDSAVRITHIPTGVVVYCQEERSQHKNKEKAFRVLSAKLAEASRRKKAEERASLRSSQVGSGDRSERIRTYNYPQNRVTEHRIGLTLYSLDRVLEGDLKEISEKLICAAHEKKMESLG